MNEPSERQELKYHNSPKYRDVTTICKCVILDIERYYAGDFNFFTLIKYTLFDLWEVRENRKFADKLETRKGQ